MSGQNKYSIYVAVIFLAGGLAAFSGSVELVVFVMLAGTIAALISMTFEQKSNDKENEEQKQWAAGLEFLRECKKHEITDLKDPYQREKASLIAQRAGCKFYDVEKLYNDTIATVEAKEARNKQVQEWNAIGALRKQEEELKTEFKRFAYHIGRNKRIATLQYQEEQYRSKAKAIRDSAYGVARFSQQREINPGVAGGIANGLLGGFAGVAAYIDAENYNAQIRMQNKQTMDFLFPAMIERMNNASILEGKADELSKDISAAFIKVVSPMPTEAVFRYLSVSAEKVDISKTGAFAIAAEVKVNASRQELMIGKSDGVIDGTIIADMYQDGKKVGSAMMVLPTFGVKSKATVCGLSTCRADSTKEYEIKFRPQHLWVMEE